MNPFAKLVNKDTPAQPSNTDAAQLFDGSNPIVSTLIKQFGPALVEKLVTVAVPAMEPLIAELRTLNMRLAQIEHNQGVMLTILAENAADEELARRMIEETPIGLTLDTGTTQPAPGVFGGEVGAIEQVL